MRCICRPSYLLHEYAKPLRIHVVRQHFLVSCKTVSHIMYHCVCRCAQMLAVLQFCSIRAVIL